MMRTITILLILLIINSATAQTASFADSIRKAYKIPELSYAVVSSDKAYEIQALGVKKIKTNNAATLNDRFRIGSNTKAITGFIAALLVKEGKLSWDTKFFDLYPEMRPGTDKAYLDVTLLQLLTFRAKLNHYTYTDAKPVKGQFKGNESEQRHQFTKWFFAQKPTHPHDTICYSNVDYVAAGLMMEKAAGKPYKQLVTELGKELGINFDFGQPNLKDQGQTWGHNASLIPEGPADNYKLNWLQAAGNINVTLPDYAKFIQLQLQGLHGKPSLLPKETFELLHYGAPIFAAGWFWDTDDNNRKFSYNTGNPGTFLTKVVVRNDEDRAFIIFSNAQTDLAEQGMDVLMDRLEEEYDK